MQDIFDYIKLPKTDRQQHLKLQDPCIERGGMSSYCKGLMAHILETTIPSGKGIHVCHACHNAKCSNPNHMYWGTAQENRLDSKENGTKCIWDNMVAKHGLEKAREMQRHGNKSLGGKANKGKPKSEEHKRKIAEAIRNKYNKK